MIPMKKMVLEVGAERPDSQVRPRKLPWKQQCQVEGEITLAKPLHTHSTAPIQDVILVFTNLCSHSAAVIIHCKPLQFNVL